MPLFITFKGFENDQFDLEPRFHDFLRLFVFIHQNPIYNSRAWVIADGDETGKRNIDRLKESFPTWGPEHFICLSKFNIEEFYPGEFQQEFKKIISLSDRNEKRKKKIDFTKKVFNWIDTNPKDAKEKFSKSAEEIISYLKMIESKIG